MLDHSKTATASPLTASADKQWGHSSAFGFGQDYSSCVLRQVLRLIDLEKVCFENGFIHLFLACRCVMIRACFVFLSVQKTSSELNGTSTSFKDSHAFCAIVHKP